MTANLLRSARWASLAALATVAALAPAARAHEPDGARHGCGVLVDAAHPWHSRVPGGNVETGDHWLTDRFGSRGTCAIGHVKLRRLLALPARDFAGRDVGRLEGGACDWDVQSGHERIRPFARITCHLPIRPHGRRADMSVEAFVDPDPDFIH